jgi:uncharacterized coiled-coil DUF342 family protein
MVRDYGENNWKKISAKMHKTERQCKDRFYKSLSPTINKMPWTSEEDIFLLQKIEELRNKLVLISSMMNRTDAQCKDRARKLKRQYKKYMKLLKEAELLSQATTIYSKIQKGEIISFLEENDIFEDLEWSF